MDFIQIGCITPEDLENSSNRNWLESLDDSLNVFFVAVEDGDYSLARSIVEEPISFDDPRLREGYVCFDPKTMPEGAHKILAEGRDECRAFWSGYKAYRPID